MNVHEEHSPGTELGHRLRRPHSALSCLLSSPGYRSLSYLDHLSLIAATKVKVWKSALNSSKAEHEKDVFKTEEWVEVNPFNEAPKELVTRI